MDRSYAHTTAPGRALAVALCTALCAACPGGIGDEGGEWGDEGWGEGDWGDDGWGDDGGYLPIDGNLYVHNGTDAQLSVRLRPLLTDVDIDCFEVAADPGRLLTEPIFGEATTWLLPPQTNAPVAASHPERACQAALIEGDRLPSAVLFWQSADYPAVTFPGDHPADLAERGAIVITGAQDQPHTIASPGAKLVFLRSNEDPPVLDTCELPGDTGRIAWSSVSDGTYTLGAVSVGPDGCVGHDLGAPPTWYLCLPPAILYPFVEGDQIDVSTQFSGDSELLTLRRLTAADPDDAGALELRASVGDDVLDLFGATASFLPRYTCDAAPDLVCGSVGRPGDLTVRFGDGPYFKLILGEGAQVVDGDRQHDLFLAHAEQRVVIHASCSDGPDVLGADLEIVAIQRAPALP